MINWDSLEGKKTLTFTLRYLQHHWQILKLVDGCKHGKLDQKSAPVYYNPIVFGQKLECSSKAFFNLNVLSWWPLLLCSILKCRKSSWDLQYLSLKVMFKSKWVSLQLDMNFMILTILKLEFSFIFLGFITYLRASSQNFVENHQFNVYFKQNLGNHMSNITYLHTTCTVI